MSDADAMEAGPELDCAVAKACGFEAGIINGECLRGTDDFPEMVGFRPSTDWNDAVHAAEEADLFENDLEDFSGWTPTFLTCGYGDDHDLTWYVCRSETAVAVSEAVVASATTAPLAICRAILKLAGKNEQPS